MKTIQFDGHKIRINGKYIKLSDFFEYVVQSRRVIGRLEHMFLDAAVTPIKGEDFMLLSEIETECKRHREINKERAKALLDRVKQEEEPSKKRHHRGGGDTPINVIIKAAKVLTDIYTATKSEMILEKLDAFEYMVEPLFNVETQYIRVTDRIMQLHKGDDVPIETVFEIGKLAAKKYREVYGANPPRVAMIVGKGVELVYGYTLESCRLTLDKAIKEVL